MKLWPYALAGAVFVADQASKWWIMNGLRLEQLGSVPLLPFLSFTWVENRGVSMGLFTMGSEAGRWLLVLATALIAVFVAIWLKREKHWLEACALGLVLGGALGNILDRIRFGHVVDFVHLHAGRWSFYVFNIADAAITVGVLILLVRSLMQRSDGSKEKLHDA